jgi:hypothetical protein
LTTASQEFDAVKTPTFVHPLNAGGTLSVTVTVNMQVPVLLDKSLAEQLTVVTPLLKLDPEAGLQVTVLDPSQTSLAVG